VFARITASACGGGAVADCIRTLTSDNLRALQQIYADRNTVTLADPINVEAVNMSLSDGVGQRGSCTDDPRNGVIKNLRRVANIATVVAAGNQGFTNMVAAPGCVADAVTVGNLNATASPVVVAGSSNIGNLVDLLAPGTSISSSVPKSGSVLYGFKSGTSMAAPHVAGAIVAIRSALRKNLVDPTRLTVDSIEAALVATGTPIMDTRPGGTLTKPEILVDRAVSSLLDEKTMVVTPSTPLSVSGPAGGGSFAPSTTTYAVGQLTSGPSKWRVTNWPSWLTPSITSGKGSAAPVDVRFSLNGSADTLQPGTYAGDIVFKVAAIKQTITRRATLTVTVPVPPPNDMFANASLLASLAPGETGVSDATNAGATLEPGEPDHFGHARGSVWFQYDATVSGRVHIGVAGTAATPMEPMISVFTGSSVSALTLIEGSAWGSVDFSAVAGQSYRIMVGGAPYSGSAFSFGPFRMTMTQYAPHLTLLPEVAIIEFSKRGGEPVVPASYAAELASPDGDTEFQLNAAPSWLLVSPSSGMVSFKTPTALTLSVGAEADNLPVGIYQSTLGITSPATGQQIDQLVELQIKPSASAPGNDQFGSAFFVNGVAQGATVVLSGSNTFASHEFGEPDHWNGGTKSVWWRYTAGSELLGPGANKRLFVDTHGSGYDTVLAV